MKTVLPLRTLYQRLASLPQELYDTIRRHVFATVATTIVIDHHFQLPHLLHIDQISRMAFSKLYFSRTKFIFRSPTLLIKWAKALEPRQVDAINEVILIASPRSTSVSGIGGWNLLGSVQKREILLAVGVAWKGKLEVIGLNEAENRFGVLPLDAVPCNIAE